MAQTATTKETGGEVVVDMAEVAHELRTVENLLRAGIFEVKTYNLAQTLFCVAFDRVLRLSVKCSGGEDDMAQTELKGGNP
jgi:hypothetical protein